jgi:hypothetical protein
MKIYRMLCCLILCLPALAAAEAVVERDPQTGLMSWTAEERGFSIELIQIVPDYVRAVYTTRRLPETVIERVTDYCVFGTIVRNKTDQALSYRVADWRYVTGDGERHRLKTKSQWVQEWRELGIAFRWSMLPDDQTFEVGDWGQGFTTVKLSPGDSFDLLYSWSQNDKTYHGEISGLRCAPAHSEKP